MPDITTAAASAAPPRVCENCGQPLLGEHCYSCGQPTKGLVREFSTILGDFFDTLLNIDARIIRTIGPLFARPGYLSLQYFEGHRVRFVSPVRLFVFLSVAAFVLAQWSVHVRSDGQPGVHIGTGNNGSTGGIEHATTVVEVEHLRDEARAAVAQAEKKNIDVPAAQIGLDIAKTQIDKAADRRIEQIKSGKPLSDDNSADITFNDKPWDAKSNPLVISWLPDVGNAKLNELIARAAENLKRGSKDPQLLWKAFMSAAPQTLFVLLPLFALLLKLFYVFKRRLYMEHLIVALHSHAFLCLTLGFLSVLSIVGGWLTPHSAFAGSVIAFLEVGLLIWMPVYLLIMQKRVYRQGWSMTLLKFFVLGMAYWIMLCIGALAALLISLVLM
ncbi:MAG TPA: DUF3667 domain-containing protein [Arenimonas sp.]|uniref:DUF3667 domain-containing protein n=1 Tax=Arenimonas sp. TaxID=1872635 RepID=UPI002B59FBF4|nr:DUF3667 domain-containing protein [Arenimonas sp.]HMB56229.1 DUF3667 domain-containing protein [Arenimonas sp.]